MQGNSVYGESCNLLGLTDTLHPTPKDGASERLREAGHHCGVIFGKKICRTLMASSYVDLALYDHDGRLTAVAEVKNKQGTSREWAAKLRRNLLAHGGHYKADFFSSLRLIVCTSGRTLVPHLLSSNRRMSSMLSRSSRHTLRGRE